MTQNESEFYILTYNPVCCLHLFSNHSDTSRGCSPSKLTIYSYLEIFEKLSQAAILSQSSSIRGVWPLIIANLSHLHYVCLYLLCVLCVETGKIDNILSFFNFRILVADVGIVTYRPQFKRQLQQGLYAGSCQKDHPPLSLCNICRGYIFSSSMYGTIL